MAPDTPSISVLLPVHNGAATIKAALDSLWSQSCGDFECIAVDDGSDDGTLEVLRQEAAREKRLRVVALPRVGLVSALQQGLAACRARWVARMDADDICLPRRLELQAAYLREHPEVGLVSCRVAFGGDAARQAGYAHYVQWTNTLLRHEDISKGRFRESPFAHPSVMFRRELESRHGGYKAGDFPEDYELWLRWLQAGVRMEKLPQTLFVWNDPPRRLSRTDPRYDSRRFYEVKADYLARWLVAHNPHHPHVQVLGAGRVSRKRAAYLCGHGIEITAYYDIDPRKVGHVVQGRPVLHRERIPPPGSAFLLSYVASRDAAAEIACFLLNRGHQEGKDFLLAA